MKFSREARLSGAAEFRFVFTRPDVSRDGYFKVLSRPSGRPGSRLGMAVSTRICRRATGRNRLKRIIRECFREHLGQRSNEPARDVVVLPTMKAATAANPELRASLRRLFGKPTRAGTGREVSRPA